MTKVQFHIVRKDTKRSVVTWPTSWPTGRTPHGSTTESLKSSVKASQKLHGIMRNTNDNNETDQQAKTSFQEVTDDDREIQECQSPRKPEWVPWKEQSTSATQTLFYRGLQGPSGYGYILL